MRSESLMSRDGIITISAKYVVQRTTVEVDRTPIADFAVPDVHLFEIFAAAPKDSERYKG